MNISVQHISKSIGKTEILHDISFEINENGVLGLLGPNGAGKSTLMKILVGLWNFQKGNVSVCGISATRQLSHEVTKHIGYLPENNPLYDYMYVREYLEFMDSLSTSSREKEGKGRQRERVNEAIERVGLTPMSHKKIRELSKGYRQRAGLAQAIMSDPDLLILDEPTTGLDPNQLDETRALIKELGQKRIVILSTHILQEVEAMCQRVIILSDGTIKEDTTDFDNLEQLFREKTKA